jgi:GNAT superfamily N-acetyltransferase
MPPESGSVWLRPMTRDDIAQSVPLLAQLGYELSAEELAQRFAAVTATPDHSLVIAELAGRVAGLLHVFARSAIENPREAVVQAIVVDLAHRRSGIGMALMAEAERWGREHECRSVMLSSNVARAPAHAFYGALGYRIAATSHVLRKRLPPG